MGSDSSGPGTAIRPSPKVYYPLMTKQSVAQKKLKVGWFSFTCCEDSTMIWIEMMNQRFFEWKKLLEIRHARVLQKHNRLRGLDVAFV